MDVYTEQQPGGNRTILLLFVVGLAACRRERTGSHASRSASMCCSRHGHTRQNGMRSQAEQGQR